MEIEGTGNPSFEQQYYNTESHGRHHPEIVRNAGVETVEHCHVSLISPGEHGPVDIITQFHRPFERHPDARGYPAALCGVGERKDGPALAAPIHVLDQPQENR